MTGAEIAFWALVVGVLVLLAVFLCWLIEHLSSKVEEEEKIIEEIHRLRKMEEKMHKRQVSDLAKARRKIERHEWKTWEDEL